MQKRLFNIAGPCNSNDHYMIDAMRRLGDETLLMIDRREFFLIHAARQTGKTTFLLDLANHINNAGKYYAVYCSLENAESLTEPEKGITAIINVIQTELMDKHIANAYLFTKGWNTDDPFNAILQCFRAFCAIIDKPLVLLFDEADCLSGRTLISFLRQLRNGYVTRSMYPFIHSLALVGMRNIRDYKAEYRNPEQSLGSASPFNIVSAYMTLRNFTHSEIGELYAQHTADTGQKFFDDAVSLVWEQTQGQPWLVNAIAREITMNINPDPENAVNTEMVSEAIQKITLRRDTHFDSMMARLSEDRVRRIIEPIIIGKEAAISRFSDDYSYVKDIGLIRDDRGKKEPANPIYGELIIRTLNQDAQDEIEQGDYIETVSKYIQNDIIDIDGLLCDFQIFWRENGDIWQKKYDYQEAAPHLVLQAFLQRIINGGGQIVREMAAATGRIDLCAIYKDRKYPIELKIRRAEKTYAEGVAQTARYMDTLGCGRGWLVIFDQRGDTPWSERLFQKSETVDDKTITVFGC